MTIITDKPTDEHDLDNIYTTVQHNTGFRTQIPMQYAKLLKLKDGDLVKWSTKKDDERHCLVLSKK